MKDYEFLEKTKIEFIEKDGKIVDCEFVESYPEITDSQYLNLILINNLYAPAVGDTMDELKGQVLYFCIQFKNKIYKKVRELFEENNYED